jgi:Spy/CpxP family protein refolding chaperone
LILLSGKSLMKVSPTKIERGGRALVASVLFALPFFLQAPAARAQSVKQDAPQAEQPEGARQQGRVPGNALMRRLNLTAEQRERLREIRAQSESGARELTRRVRLARRALDEAIYADGLDESVVEQRARALTDAQAEVLRLRMTTELKVRRVLTPEQLRAFRQLRRQAQRRQRLQRRLGGVEQPPPPGEN